MDGVRAITTPANELPDGLTVHTRLADQVPYIEITTATGRTLLDLSCTGAMNLGLQLIAAAGEGLNRQIARALPQSWPAELPETR